MNETLASTLTTASAIAAGTTGGVYLAFSIMVMPSLRSRPAFEAIVTMCTINDMAVRVPFMTLFFGGAVTAAAVIVTEFTNGEIVNFNYARTIGAALALASFFVTMAFNVPRNNALARGSAEDETAVWREFDRGWSRANRVRTALAIIGAVVLAAH